VALLTAAALGLGCAGNSRPVEACVQITSGTNLHTYDGQPHVLHVYFYALKSSLAFRQMDVQMLLAGTETPAGVVEGPLELIVAPSSVVEFREALDPDTVELGIVADYFRGPDDPPGRRKAVVKATCGLFRTPKIRLTPTDLLVE
jgi:predicted component of type VI protein secretion system